MSNGRDGQNFISPLTSLTGTLRPTKRLPKRAPTFERYIVIGQSGDLFTKVRLYCYDASLEYPETSLFLQLKNGAGSCFAKITPVDLRTLVEQLTLWLSEYERILPNLESKENQVKATFKYYSQLNNLQEISRSMGVPVQRDYPAGTEALGSFEGELVEEGRLRDDRGRFV